MPATRRGCSSYFKLNEHDFVGPLGMRLAPGLRKIHGRGVLVATIGDHWKFGQLRGEIWNLSRKHGPESNWVHAARMKYAQALFEAGEYEDARGEFAKVVKRKRAEGLDIRDGFLRSSEIGYGNSQIRLKNYREGVREFREMADRYDRVLGIDHVDAIEMHDSLGVMLFKLGKIDEAEKEAAIVVERRVAARDPDVERAREVHAIYLGELQRRRGPSKLRRL